MSSGEWRESCEAVPNHRFKTCPCKQLNVPARWSPPSPNKSRRSRTGRGKAAKSRVFPPLLRTETTRVVHLERSLNGAGGKSSDNG